MASTGAMNSTDSAIEIGAAGTDSCIKTEVEVKHESVECVVCTSRGSDGGEAAAARTASGTRLLDFLRRVVRCELGAAVAARRVCSHCLHLIDVLEQAELEYLKLKEAFEAIISKNPLFDNGRLESHTVKVEMELENGFQDVCTNRSDSEDEPLAVTKKKRNQKPVKRKLKVYPNKRKQRIKNSIEKEKNSIQRFIDETLPVEDEYFGNREVKKEDSADGSETSHFNNGLDGLLKIEVGADDLDDEDYESESADGSEEALEGVRAARGARGRGAGRGRRGRGRGRAAAEPKWQRRVVHQCNQCNAKYTSLKRLESHLSKHSAGMPPYICEVCGARYKHKRACDIHVALHKGISDWKCEECDKLFPSKSALQRHNNIHTGKLNYQCDLCGKSFIHTSSFKMHKLSHSGVKPHACDVCGLALMTRSHLKRHKRVHSGEKRHECGVCGKRFSERYNLAAHSKSHEVAGGAPPPDAPRRRLFRCPYCQDRFERRYMLERHVSSTHGRTLERAPATPRNTMSKLLKQQAAGRAGPGSAGPGAAEGELAGSTAPHTPQTPADVSPPKRARSPALAGAARPPAPAALALHKLQLSSAATSVSAGAWSAAYGAEFGLRPDYH